MRERKDRGVWKLLCLKVLKTVKPSGCKAKRVSNQPVHPGPQTRVYTHTRARAQKHTHTHRVQSHNTDTQTRVQSQTDRQTDRHTHTHTRRNTHTQSHITATHARTMIMKLGEAHRRLFPEGLLHLRVQSLRDSLSFCGLFLFMRVECA